MTVSIMKHADRAYRYIARTFDAASEAPFADLICTTAMPLWKSLRRSGLLSSVETFRKVGDIDLQTSTLPVRDWAYFVLLELGESVPVEDILAAEQAVGLEASFLNARDVAYLSCEALVRPAAAGTAIPRPSTHFSAPPATQQAGIEYIDIPSAHWQEYHEFMRDIMGPVGARLVQTGNSYRVQIMERTRILHWDPSLPPWNRVHILWGEFDDPRNGFVRHTDAAIRALFGAGQDVLSMLGRTSHYRTKPRMSKNVRIEQLCLD